MVRPGISGRLGRDRIQDGLVGKRSLNILEHLCNGRRLEVCCRVGLTAITARNLERAGPSRTAVAALKPLGKTMS